MAKHELLGGLTFLEVFTSNLDVDNYTKPGFLPRYEFTWAYCIARYIHRYQGHSKVGARKPLQQGWIQGEGPGGLVRPPFTFYIHVLASYLLSVTLKVKSGNVHLARKMKGPVVKKWV